MPYDFFDHTGDIGVALTGRTVAELFGAAAAAFTDTLTSIEGVEPRQPEEIELAAPELDLLLVDFLSELLYRFDTRGWLTRDAQVVLRESGEGWELSATLLGEKQDPARHHGRVLIKAVTYHQLEVTQREGTWAARIVLDI